MYTEHSQKQKKKFELPNIMASKAKLVISRKINSKPEGFAYFFIVNPVWITSHLL